MADFARMWADELEAAELYRALAAASGDPRRQAVLERLAEAEERHAAHWERVLAENGQSTPRRKTSRRTRLLKFIARRFGADAVLPLVLRAEASDAAKYRDIPEAPAAMSDEEMAHGRTVALLEGDPAGDSIARSEGRHRIAVGGALRAATFGVQDGLVSNLLLVLGVAGGTAERSVLLLTGLAGLLAGAFSMAAGEWSSVQSQRELYQREIDVEREELKAFPEEERAELALIYQAKGLAPEEAEALARRIMSRPDTALETLTREELGLSSGGLGSPWVAAGASFAAFAAGAAVPVVPFFAGTGIAAVTVAVVISAMAIFAVGWLNSLLTGRSPLRTGLRTLGIAALAGVASFSLGSVIGANV